MNMGSIDQRQVVCVGNLIYCSTMACGVCDGLIENQT